VRSGTNTDGMFDLRSAGTEAGASARRPEVGKDEATESSATSAAMEEWLRETSVAFTLGG